MNVPDAISGAKIVVLTGAGASVPLGLFTTRQFLEDFKANDARALKQQGLEVPLSFVLSEAAVENFDIEGVLDLLETP